MKKSVGKFAVPPADPGKPALTARPFSGQYIDNMSQVLLGSLLSGVHAIILGAPGWGKTTYTKAVAEQVSAGHYVFKRLEASTPVETVEGMPDTAALLASPPVYRQVLTGTFFDPDARIIIADEAGRPHDAVFDILLNAMDRQDAIDLDQAPVFWLTSNFMLPSDRRQATLDRIGIWLWLDTGDVDTEEVVNTQLSVLGTGVVPPVAEKFPTWDEVIRIRKARPTATSAKAISDLLQNLVNEAINASRDAKSGRDKTWTFRPNPRRLEQWARVLFRNSVYHLGTADFSVVPAEALSLLKWMWPCPTREEANQWYAVAGSVTDMIGTAIAAVQKMAYERFSGIVGNKEKANISESKVTELGMALAESEHTLRQIGGNDPRVGHALSQINQLFNELVTGNNII